MKPPHLAATLISNCVRNLRFQRQAHLWPDVLTRYRALRCCPHSAGTRGKTSAPTIANPCPVLAAGTGRLVADSARAAVGTDAIVMARGRPPAFRTTEGWARGVLLEAGAISECEEHGGMKDRGDPHARERALEM